MLVIKKILNIPYWAITTIRNFFYDKNILSVYKSRLKIISIGNISVGGNGKTPFAISLIKKIQSEYPELKLALLSRGYGGKYSVLAEVDSSLDTKKFGDEPCLIKKITNVSVVVAAKRSIGLKYIEENNLADIVILDDALQHRAVARDENLLLVDISKNNWQKTFIENLLLPIGNFRESFPQVKKRITKLVLVNRSTLAIDFYSSRCFFNKLGIASANIFIAQQRYKFCKHIITKENLGFNEDICLFSSIASPESFLTTVKNCGYINIKNTKFFRDHFAYSEDIILSLIKENTNLKFICTEKDAIKICKFDSQILEKIYVLEVYMDIEDLDLKEFKLSSITSVDSALNGKLTQ